jgi:DNA mismatch repair protein MutL
MNSAPRIRILGPELADQISAGEVLERPASAVKELMENALDAGASRIDIDVEGGGRRLIRVADNGCGMSAEEARLALQRHATSKIRKIEDLQALKTFGFRGEALPSIAAVARLVVSTKVKDATAGFRLALDGAVERESGDVGMADGTQIEVRDLFFNTPARQKFLKTEATESANISEAVLRLGLGHPEVHFRLCAAGKTILDLPPHKTLGERVRAALARRGASSLHEASGEEHGVRVRGFLGSPEEAASSSRSTFLFVGLRYIRDRSLLHALSMGYGELLEKRRYPLAALFIDVDGEDLDVNVHPQKMEVRFSRPQDVYGAVRHVVSAAIARGPWLAPQPMRAYTLPPAARNTGDFGKTKAYGATSDNLNLNLRPASASADDEDDGEAPSQALPAAAAPAVVSHAQDAAPAPAVHDNPDAFFAALDYIGQLHRTYLVCQGQGELILLDQHAAHERIAFERLRVSHSQHTIAQQRLLFPVPIQVDDSALATAGSTHAQEVLAGLGFDLELFGPNTVLLRAVPDLLKDVDPKPLVLDLLNRLSEGTHPELAQERLDHILATMACHSVVRAGDTLRREQAIALLGQLDSVNLRSHCPHGRPVLLRMSISEIERRFGRT